MITTIRRILRLAGPRATRLRWGFVAALVESLFETAPFIALLLIFSPIAQNQPLTQATILIAAAVLLVGLLGRAAARYTVYRLQSGAGYEIVAEHRIALGDRLRRAPMGFFSAGRTGEVSTVITTDLAFLELYAMHVLDRVASGLISTAVVSVFVFVFDWRMGLVFWAGLIAGLIVYRALARHAERVAAQQRAVQATMAATVLEYIRGIGVIKAFNLGGSRTTAFADAITEHSAAAYRVERTLVPWNALFSACFRIAAGAILFLAPALTLLGELTPVQMLVAVIATFTVYAPIETAGSLTGLMRLTEASLDRVDAVAALPALTGDRDVAPERFEISFTDVGFSYQPGAPVLSGVTFAAPARSMTALVGASGSGKSTVTRLVARFWDADSGTVRIGGHDVRSLTPEAVLSVVTTVFQDVFLFQDTVLENIRMGRPEATQDEVIAAARRAQCHEFIEALPDGYHTVLGEGGGTLSGGQRQRLSIARAILKDAPIVLLDEITASVDAENEHLIHTAIRELVADKTILVIAHKLATIRDADQILVLDDGRISQRGTHDVLITQPGVYRDFWQARRAAESWELAASADPHAAA